MRPCNGFLPTIYSLRLMMLAVLSKPMQDGMVLLTELEKERRTFTYALVGTHGLWGQGFEAMGLDVARYLPSNHAEEVAYPVDILASTRYKMNEIKRASVNRLAAHMVGSAKEILKQDPIWHPIHQNPKVQFAKHIRNGVFHGNSFQLGGKDPSKQAEWSGVEITADREGETVFTDIKGDIWTTGGEVELKQGLLECGDLLQLMNDLLDITEEAINQSNCHSDASRPVDPDGFAGL